MTTSCALFTSMNSSILLVETLFRMDNNIFRILKCHAVICIQNGDTTRNKEDQIMPSVASNTEFHSYYISLLLPFFCCVTRIKLQYTKVNLHHCFIRDSNSFHSTYIQTCPYRFHFHQHCLFLTKSVSIRCLIPIIIANCLPCANYVLHFS